MSYPTENTIPCTKCGAIEWRASGERMECAGCGRFVGYIKREGAKPKPKPKRATSKKKAG